MSCVSSATEPPSPSKSLSQPGSIEQSQPQPTTPTKATTNAGGFVPVLPSGVPVLNLDVDYVTDVTISRLATGLLGHVLFLKNQIPLPVPQLTKMTSQKSSTSKGAKARAELLATYDTLTSHLATTFSALSIALYQSASEEKRKKLEDQGSHAYLAVVCGPSPGAARSRTFLAVDKFETRQGARQEGGDENAIGQEAEGIRREIDEDGGVEPEDGFSSAEEPEPSDDETESDLSSDESDNDSGEQDAPKSGPAFPSTPLRTFQVAKDDDPKHPVTPSSIPARMMLSSKPPPATPLVPLRQIKVHMKPRASSEPPPSQTYADEQRFLINTERLLSRVLATADAEGYGFSSEMAPTKTHVLIRAPRRFSHPAWVPQQNLTKSLDSSLDEFLVRSRAVDRESSDIAGQGKKGSAGRKAKQQQQMSEGVWATAKRGLCIPEAVDQPQVDEALDDGNDMIWWTWEGKFVGFSEW